MRKQQFNPPPPKGAVKPPPPPAPPAIHINDYRRNEIQWNALMELKQRIEQCTPEQIEAIRRILDPGSVVI